MLSQGVHTIGMMAKRSSITLALVAFAVVAFGCQEKATKFETAAAQMGDIRDVVPAIGQIHPVVQIEVRASAPGRVTAVYVRANERVRAGQPLARLRPERARLSVEGARADSVAAQAGVRQAQARAEQADREHRNRRVLADRGFISSGALEAVASASEEANAAVARARAEAASADVRLRTATVQMDEVVIRAPQDGTVLSTAIEVGQAVDPTSVEPIFIVVSDTSKMRVRALVAEPDIGRIVRDMQASFTVEAYPNRTFSGKVIEVLRSPVRERAFVSYPVIIEVANDEGLLFPGMTAAVEFIHTDLRNVLKAPLAALYFTPADYLPDLPAPLMRRLERTGLSEDRDALMGAEAGSLYARGKRRMFVLTRTGPEVREVRVGGQTSEAVEISEGLRPGDLVILGSSRSSQPDSKSAE